MAGTVKVSLEISEDEMKAVEEIAARYGLSRQDAIRQAIRREKFLVKPLEEGSQLLLRNPKGKLVEVVAVKE